MLNKVFGIGLGRTGSVSLTLALKQIGISVDHYPGDLTKRELLDGKGQLGILNAKQGIVDGIQPFYRRLDRAYPNSKFILTLREKEGFKKSRRQLRALLATLRPKMNVLHSKYHEHCYMYLFGSIDPPATLIYEGYKRHVADVKEYFKDRPDDLLSIDITSGEGWEKLCPFLSKNIPNTPFPQSNSSVDLDLMERRIEGLWQNVHDTVPSGKRILLIDDCSLGVCFHNHEAAPFPHRNGTWWGLPKNSESAVEELHKAMEDGVEYLVFAWPSFWWFEYYPGFIEHVQSRCRKIMSNERCIIYACHNLR